MASTINAITSGGGGIAVGGDTSGVIALQSNGTTFATGNQYGIGLGTAVPSSGIGIAFPATQSASSNANTLDDYEEGTWTPALTFVTGGTTGITYGSRSATYTKIGDTVYIAMDFSLSSKGSATGSAYISGLPFTVSSAVSNVMVMPCLLGNASSLPSTLVAGALSTNIYLYYTYASGYTNLQNTTFNNNSSVTICGSYKVA